jgi:hypothetical protein
VQADEAGNLRITFGKGRTHTHRDTHPATLPPCHPATLPPL